MKITFLQNLPILMAAFKPCSALLTQPLANNSLEILIFFPLYCAFKPKVIDPNIE